MGQEEEEKALERGSYSIFGGSEPLLGLGERHLHDSGFLEGLKTERRTVICIGGRSGAVQKWHQNH